MPKTDRNVRKEINKQRKTASHDFISSAFMVTLKWIFTGLAEVRADEGDTPLVEAMVLTNDLFSAVKVQSEQQLPSGGIQIHREGHSASWKVFASIKPENVGENIITCPQLGKNDDKKSKCYASLQHLVTQPKTHTDYSPLLF